MRWGKREQVKYKTIEELKEASSLERNRIFDIKVEEGRKRLLRMGKRLRKVMIEALMFDPGELDSNSFIIHPFVLYINELDILKVIKICEGCGMVLYDKLVITPLNLGEALYLEKYDQLECSVCEEKEKQKKLYDIPDPSRACSDGGDFKNSSGRYLAHKDMKVKKERRVQ